MKKGYTLVELLAVVVILGVIALISVPAISGVINNSRKGSYERQKELIENAARTYTSQNPDKLDSKCISLSDLIDAGLISNDVVIDPKTNKPMNGSIKITFENKKYKYEYDDSPCS